MKSVVARAIAERAHREQLDTDGTRLIAHVRRVAAATSGPARTVAWLHEVLESTDMAEETLLAEGLSDDELRALRLLTRLPGDRSEERYLAHIARIAASAGLSGTLARTVKQADLEDRLQHPCRRPDGWFPPHGRGLAALETACARKAAPGPRRRFGGAVVGSLRSTRWDVPDTGPWIAS
jgi:hypothetical protein